ncbi:hypothetical protein Ocin01_00753 [Orchesella cincta]|uniref:Protein quiver n=1 Tax=Orchesella cincta TaxID=48709 RepID=A0A1D2NLW7_ORCCI|nr:hypothetical protein Ocin01_00753 [Orchesella cincta]
MSNSIYILLIVCTLLILVTNGVDGIECYSCYHLEGGQFSESDLEKFPIGGFKGHKSCKSGKTPDDTYTTTCNADEDNTVATCVKLFYNGKLVNSSEVEYKLTFRTCFVAYENENFTQTCAESTIFDIGNYAAPSSPIKDLISEYGSLIGDRTGTFCSCDSDKCNTGASCMSSLFTIVMLGFTLLTFSL